jgi:S1-C subfamily serine protease
MVALDTELEPSQNVTYACFAPSRLLDFDKISSMGLAGLGEAVFALGYPLGITSLKTDLPIAKAGYLSSTPGEELTVQLGCLARNQSQTIKVLSGKVILVDGLIVPGNSGGPVVLEYGLRTRLNPQTHQFEFTAAPIDNYVIGFISSGVGPSGLTTVIGTDYIKEMMSSYKPPSP